MNKKKITIFVIVFTLLFLSYYYINTIKKDLSTIDKTPENNSSNSNIIENVKYSSNNTNGDEYIITASEGEIDINNNNIIYLTNVKATIKLSNTKKVFISSDFGKYNINNFDTIFNKNVIIKYLSNNIKGDYLDFSIARNSMVISRNVIYTNFENILKSDVIEMDIKTKDTKIFMYEKNNKVNVKSIN